MVRRHLMQLTSLAVIYAGMPSAHADVSGFACPKAGTIEQRGVYNTKYTGASPTDPYLCNRLDAWDKPQSALFNFYGGPEASNAEIRAAMLDLLSGRKTSVTITTGSGSTEAWTFLRREQVLIAGKPIDTMVFDVDRQRFASSRRPFHGRYTRWLDPKNGLWVKAVLTIISGEIADERKPYVDSLITLP